MQVQFQGRPLKLLGLKINVGDRGRDVRLSGSDLKPVLPLAESQGQTRLLLTIPSLDVPIWADVGSQFNQILATLTSESWPKIAGFLISADLPFAQTRWQQAEQIEFLLPLSDYRDLDFGRSWGLLIQAWGCWPLLFMWLIRRG